MKQNSFNFTINAPKRFVLFICISIICTLIASVAVGILTYNGATTPRTRIATVIQDLFMFIVPAMATAIIICRRPADFLQLSAKPSLWLGMLVVATVVASVPAMNLIIKWNAAMHLPEALSGVEQWMRAGEDKAAAFTQTLFGGTGTGSLIIALLIVGVLAAFSEEIYFRGTLQRLFTTAGVGIHISVWTTAIIFSAVHFQFFGFVPRLLLGALFGYAVVWSGNLWLGVLAHFTNNAIAAIGMTVAESSELVKAISPADNVITNEDMIFASGSAAVTALLIIALYRACRGINRTSCD